MAALRALQQHAQILSDEAARLDTAATSAIGAFSHVSALVDSAGRESIINRAFTANVLGRAMEQIVCRPMRNIAP
jgi:hypothetical protein